ncbi:OmpA family protein [Sphingobacterium allocomposti]|uniref:OmpA family protein n=1 Tax=Sphingobacterium allocomposti TaxID=415956 RepID=A0A5S5DNJ6_9SPHI|nr:OmpA family protein [Sphingobacterium composti Yoo et al. 2007 non Ten et al. 2007]TYP96948.1 OmpA family protein [Sphingobacterium composti Yoo et al. 2007 non Ten et al. 2007]HLS94244.1 OmpA family protein [Sphingobacterium sp.]
MKHISTVALMAAVALGFGSCKQQAIMVNPGAVVTKDGTDDGLKNVKSEFEDATRTNEGIKFTISSDLLFPTNSSYLTDKAKVELSKLAKLLKEDTSKKIRVDGHTDSTGEAGYNQWLSEKRAASVKKFLEDAGIASSRITTKGVGQTKPVADNKTPEGRQKNRRVEVIILN